MKPNLAAARAARPLVLSVAVVLLAGCGAGAASLATDRAAAPTTTSTGAPPEPATTTPPTAPAATSTPPATATGAASASATGASSGDVTAAVQSALGLYEKVPRNPNDPAAGDVWFSVDDFTGHLSPDVIARLDALHRSGYFSDRVCAAEYFTGTQNGLDNAPTIVSAHGDAGGTVTVVIRRPVTPVRPDLMLVMTRRNGVWLATELATGGGPSASIFAAKPNC
jgi:hypothetical protein